MKNKIVDLKKSVLVLDIETCSSYLDGEPISIRDDFDNYIKFAKVKFFGCYSYKYDKYICDETKGNEINIKNFINEHDVIVGFNSDAFDIEVLKNCNLFTDKYVNQVDCQVILGTSNFAKRDGQSFKKRGELMNYKSKNNSLKEWAKAMKLETQKGDIDYNIFFKDEFSPEEKKEILIYLESDVKATKQMFDKLWDFWMPFTEFISEQNVMNLSWIKSSIASLTYKAACNTLGVEETYAEKREDYVAEEMGGRAIQPSESEVWGCWDIDFLSLYPNIFAQFGLFNEVEIEGKSQEDIDKLWHGNEIFKVRGYYDIENQSALGKDVLNKLKIRFAIKKVLKQYKIDKNIVVIPDILKDIVPDNRFDAEVIKKLEGLVYALKIFLNSLYGVTRSPIFEKVHSPNAGYDCCWIGQQIHEYIENFFTERGYPAKGGFTDSLFIKAKKGDTKEHIQSLCDEVVEEMKKFIPFPAETYGLAIECFMDYVMFHYDKKTERYLKNNYCYITDGKVKVVGFPIIKSNATKLSAKIFKEYLEPKILRETMAKFSMDWIKDIIDKNVKLEDIAIAYNCKPARFYKDRIDKEGIAHPSSNIYAQISRTYTDGLGGIVLVVKNKRVGKIGSAIKKLNNGKKIGKNDWFYGELHICINENVSKEEIDLTKVYHELAPFCKEGEIK